MGLQDLLAVVLGVKTAEALEERRQAQANSGWAVREAQAELAAQIAEQDRLTAEWEAFLEPLLERLATLVPELEWPLRSQARTITPEPGSMREMFHLPLRVGPVQVWKASCLEPLYAAMISGGDWAKYCRARDWFRHREKHQLGYDLPPMVPTAKEFESACRWVAAANTADPGLLDEIIDAYLGDPGGGSADTIQWMRWTVGLAPLQRLPPTKHCPSCAESVKRAARVCRFCGHEFTAPA